VASPTLSGSFDHGTAVPGAGLRRVASSVSSGGRESTTEDRYDALAGDHAECAVCFEPLYAAPTAVFVRPVASQAGHGRCCHHFFHARCAEEVARTHHECPLCRAPFTGTLTVPTIDGDPDGWFKACDMDGDGELNAREVARKPPVVLNRGSGRGHRDARALITLFFFFFFFLERLRPVLLSSGV
jgi:hypothetical protein